MMAPTQSTNSSNGSRANNNHGSNNSDNNLDAASTATTKNIPVQKYLTNCKSLYSCIYCRTHLANHDELVSRSFQGNHGRAYLFNSLVNISCGQAVQRELNTGPHAVADINCSNCHKTLGWKYEKAYVETQKYKEGKYIIELAHVVRENRHLEFDKGEMFLERNRNKGSCHYQRHRYSSKHWQGSSSSNDQNNRRSLQCGANNISNNNNDITNHRSSLPPSLAGHSNEEANRGVAGSGQYNYDYDYDDDDDEELMFPFYDDMCSSNRLSYPNSLASSQHNRLRRSLYLDSTPYDWKYATSAYSSAEENSNTEASTSGSSSSGYTSGPEFNQSAGSQKLKPELRTTTTTTSSSTKEYLTDESGLSDLSPPSASSSMLSHESPGQMSYHNNNRNNNLNNSDGNKYKVSESNGSSSGSDGSSSSNSRSSSRGRKNSGHHEQETYTNDDMQFKFEAELPVNNNNRNVGSTHEQSDKHCDQLISDTKYIGTQQTSHHNNHPPVVNNDNNNNKNLSEIGHERSRDQMPTSSSSSSSSTAPTVGPITPGQNPTDEADSILVNSINLDDEEFYDCFTDHEVSSMFVESGSTSTLKIVE